MAVNTGFLKRSPLSPLPLSCHLWKLSQHSWEGSRWMASANDVICSQPGWSALPGCCVTVWKAASPKEAVPGPPLDSLTSRGVGEGEGSWFYQAYSPELSMAWSLHNWFLSPPDPLLPLSNETCSASITQIVRDAEHIKSEKSYNSLGPSRTLKATREPRAVSGGISKPKWCVLWERGFRVGSRVQLCALRQVAESLWASVSAFLRNIVVKAAPWSFRIMERN